MYNKYLSFCMFSKDPSTRKEEKKEKNNECDNV